ncbi:hypothetical protein BN1723_016338 [Verticillium longisporum]|uniref:Uncharacterized protein n=1 Tax=Verticillium longisporum TaxID=100787 RepID=A0A0G4NDE4_VERLO|nr:hypothetical protein BN1723_016338 [Verticillium longisporum]
MVTEKTAAARIWEGAIARTRELAVEAENTIAKFSPNTVALEIKGPDLPDLSFYDLPGIFRNSGYEEDEYLVHVVENLAVQHISENDALIIWAVPMNADPETSSTLSIIRKVGAQKRTIGVMTKADLLPNQGSNSYSQWLSMLRGERHLIGHEYFITSRRAEQDLDRQTQWEEALFNGKHENWPEEFAEFSDRCGVERLKEALSEKLGKEFAKNLPSIKSKIFDELRKNEKRLSNLPELPTNIEYEVRKSLIEFTAIVKDKIRGNEFSSAFGLLAGSFRECLLHAKPKFSLKHKSDVPVLEISDDDEPASASRKRGPQASSNGASKRPPHVGSNGSFSQASQAGLQMKTEEATVRNGTPTPHTPSRGSVRPSVLPAPFQNFTSLGSGFRSIGAIREDIQAKTKAGMPNIVPSEVYNDLCKLAVKHWNHPMLVFLEAVMSHLQVIVNQALDQAFGKLKRRLVFKDSRRHMEAFLSSRRSKALEFLTELYEMESYQLFTINHDAFTLYELEEGRLLKRYRHHAQQQGSPELAKPSANILPPVFIHPTATVDATAKLGPNVSIGPRAVIGPGVRIKEAVVLEDSEVKHDACVLYSIIGWGSRVGAWARVEGTPMAVNSHTTSIIKNGVKVQSITILGKDCGVGDEVRVQNCVCLPYKELKRDVANEVIM